MKHKKIILAGKNRPEEIDQERRKAMAALLAAGASLSGVAATSILSACATSGANLRRQPANQNNYSVTVLKSDRIAIIGAGAAGISAAHYLRERGYKNIVIFEELNRIGGKCCSIKIDGQVYDMGAVFTTSSYTEVMALAKRFQVELGDLQGQDASVMLEQEKLGFHTSSVADKAALLGVSVEYLQKINMPEIQSVFSPGFRFLSPSLMVPFSEWMKKNSISPKTLESFFGYTFTPFGYGYTNDVPAAYAIKYYENKLVTSLIQQSSNLKMVTRGYQNLWENVAKNMDVRLNSPIEKIIRNRDSEMISIKTKNNSAIENFNFAILTSALDTSISFLDAEPMEREIFDRIKNYYYYTFAIQTPKNFPSTGFLPVNYSYDRREHPLCWLKRWKDQDLAIFYVLSDRADNFDIIISNIFSDLSRHKFQLGKVREARCWKYFPHFKTPDLQNKIYDKLEALQGRGNMFFAGEIMNFSTVELTTRYSKYLVDQFFLAGTF